MPLSGRTRVTTTLVEVLVGAHRGRGFESLRLHQQSTRREVTAITDTQVQLQEQYMTTHAQLERDPAATRQAWEGAIEQLREIDVSKPTPEDFVKANSLIAFCQQCLTAVAIRNSNFNG